MRFPLFLLLLLPALSSHAQNNIADAYLVRNNGDTMRGQVLLPRDFDFGFDKSFVDLAWLRGDSIRVYPIDSVAAFGLRKRKLEAHYRRLLLQGDRKPYLAKVLEAGPLLNLYYGDYGYVVIAPTVLYGGGLVNAGPVPSWRTEVADLMVLQNRAGELLVIRQKSWTRGRKQLRAFLEKSPELQGLVKDLPKAFAELPLFVSTANGQ
jgi:hypothetical protein